MQYFDNNAIENTKHKLHHILTSQNNINLLNECVYLLILKRLMKCLFSAISLFTTPEIKINIQN